MCADQVQLFDELTTALYTTPDNQVRENAESRLKQIASHPSYITQVKTVLGKLFVM